MKRQVILLMLTAVLVLSFVSAGFAGGADIVVNPPDELPYVNQEITLTYFAQFGDELKIEDNEAIELFAQKTNIRIDLRRLQDKDSKTLIIASGDYGDIIKDHFTDIEVANYGPKQGIFIALDDLIENYSSVVKERLASDSRYRVSALAHDGKIYGLPQFKEEVFSHPQAPQKFWINSSWLAKLDLKKPETTKEFKEVMMAFKHNDLNENGLSDEIPISGAINTASAEPEYFLLNSFTYVNKNNFLNVVDGEVQFVANTPEYREGLLYVRDLYREGMIDPASFTQDLAQLTQLGTSDPEILGGFAALHPAMGIDIADQERSSHYDYLVNLEGPNGARYAVYAGTNGYVDGAEVAITDRCKYPEAAMRVIDFFFSDAAYFDEREEGISYDWNNDPSLVDMYGNPALYFAYNTYESDALRKTIETDGLPLSTTSRLWGRQVANLDGDIFDPVNYELRLAAATMAYSEFFPSEVMIIGKFDQNAIDELSNMQVSIINYVKQATTRFIVDDMNIENEWDAYVQALENLNITRYVEIQQQGYDALTGME